MLKGIITGVSTDAVNGNSTIDVKIVSRVSTAGTNYEINYAEANPAASIEAGDGVSFVTNSGVTTGTSSAATSIDWYNDQTLNLTNSTIYWKSIAAKPVSTNFSTSRSGEGDALHVVVVDDNGSVTGVQGSILG